MGHQRDWFNEDVRQWLWRAVNPLFQALGWHSVGSTGESQLAAIIPMEIEAFEEVMHHDLGFSRNNWAYLKHRESGEWSDGSWVLRPDGFWSDHQLHVTLYDGSPLDEGPSHVTFCYAHWELNFWRHPIGHVREHGFSPQDGVDLFRAVLDDEGWLDYSTP